jgi:hypothetical protein
MNISDLTIEGEQRGFIPVDLLLIGDTTCGGSLGNISFTGLDLISPYANQAAIRLTADSATHAPSWITLSGLGLPGGSSYGVGVQIDYGTNITLDLANIVSSAIDLVIGPLTNVTGPIYIKAPSYATWTTSIDATTLSNVIGPANIALFSPTPGSSSLIGLSGTATSHTGDTTETTLGTCTVPANSMGANGRIEVTSNWSYTNSANSKQIRVKFGGTSMWNSGVTTTSYLPLVTTIQNANATGAQTGTPANQTSSFSATAGTVSSAAIDTTAAQTITMTGTLTNTGETITLQSFICKLFPAS